MRRKPELRDRRGGGKQAILRNIKVKTDGTISPTIRTMSFEFDLLGCFTHQDKEYKNNTFKGKNTGSVLSPLQVPGKLSNDDESRLMVIIQC